MKYRIKGGDNANSTVDDRERRKDLSCSYCKPNRGENAKRRGRYGKGKPRYKTQSKGK